MLTEEQLTKIMPYAKARVKTFLPHLVKSMQEFEINTPLRMAAFLAQVGHESGQLRYVKELASGAAYEGRKDLGNTQPGDGVKYKGRGLIQVTGRENYTKVMIALAVNCLEHPEVLETPENACRSAAWWWKEHGCNEIADSGDFVKLTRRINGGTNGLEDRQKLFEVAKQVLGVT